MTIKSKPLPVMFSFKLGKLLKLVNAEYEIFEECRNSLIKIFGEEENGNFRVKPEHEEEFFSRMEELVSQPVENNLFPKLNLLDFPPDFQLSPEGFSFLEPFIEE